MRSTDPATQEQIDNRLDLKLMCALNKSDPTQFRKYLRDHINELPEWQKLLPDVALSDIVRIPTQMVSEFNDRALQVQLDYHFERLLLPTMSQKQVVDYMLSVTNKLTIQPLSLEGPILLEGLHHALIFSALYTVLVHLVENEGYNHLLMMHQHQAPDPRVLLQKSLFENRYGLATTLVHFDATWFRAIKKNLTERTVIIAMGDLPAPFSVSNKEIALTLPSAGTGRMIYHQPTYSVAERICQRLSFTHLQCDFPTDDTIVLRHNDGSPLRSAMTDWVFWPSLHDMYQEVTAAA